MWFASQKSKSFIKYLSIKPWVKHVVCILIWVKLCNFNKPPRCREEKPYQICKYESAAVKGITPGLHITMIVFMAESHFIFRGRFFRERVGVAMRNEPTRGTMSRFWVKYQDRILAGSTLWIGGKPLATKFSRRPGIDTWTKLDWHFDNPVHSASIHSNFLSMVLLMKERRIHLIAA